MRYKNDNLGQGGLAGMDPVWGALIASGIGTASAIGARGLGGPKAQEWSEGFGLLVGGLAAGAMYFFPGTREAGKIGLAFVGVNQGLRLLEKFLFGGNGAAPAIAPSAPVGWVTTQQEQMYGLGMPSMHQMNGQMGYAMATDQPPRLAGHIAGPMADTGQPPNVSMMGGSMNGASLAGMYGATLFGR